MYAQVEGLGRVDVGCVRNMDIAYLQLILIIVSDV